MVFRPSTWCKINSLMILNSLPRGMFLQRLIHIRANIIHVAVIQCFSPLFRSCHHTLGPLPAFHFARQRRPRRHQPLTCLRPQQPRLPRFRCSYFSFPACTHQQMKILLVRRTDRTKDRSGNQWCSASSDLLCGKDREDLKSYLKVASPFKNGSYVMM